jgi:hypothetical protein
VVDENQGAGNQQGRGLSMPAVMVLANRRSRTHPTQFFKERAP